MTILIAERQGGRRHPCPGIKGSTLGIVTKASNKKGIVKVSVQPKRAGIVSFAPVAHKQCKPPRIGVVGVFMPPVTG